MGSFILKATPESTKYVVWSSIVDAPIAYGTPAAIQKSHRDMTDDRFARADTKGSSIYSGDYGWNSKYRTLIVRELGHNDAFYELSLDNLEPFVETIIAADGDRDAEQVALSEFCDKNTPLG